jgi:2-phospho-L-lactate guanylyltransferase
MIAALVPVKNLASSKSRLVPHLGRSAVQRLSLAMLSDVLETLDAVPALDRIAVITPDPEIAEVARSLHSEVLLRCDTGLNPSIEQASSELASASDDVSLIVLGDVAGAHSADIEALLDAAPRGGVALAPSSDGGTSALLRSPWNAIPVGFGPDSAATHKNLAAAAGVRFCEISLPSLALDIDVPEDLEKFLHTTPFVDPRAAGTRTRALLRELLSELAS